MVLNMKMGNGKVGRNRELEELSKGENIVKYLDEYMVLNMKMGNGKVGRNRELEELSK